MNIDKYDNLPFRESRKEYLTRKYLDMWNLNKFDHEGMYYDYRLSKLANWIIRKFIGKQFDKAFSYYCKKVPKNKQKIFLDYFEIHPVYGDKWNDYYIDKQDNIQLKKKL